MKNTIYKAVFIIFLLITILYGLLSITLIYLNLPNKIETNYEIAFNCSIKTIASHYPETIPSDFKETVKNEIESCNATVMGVRTVIVNFLKEGKYIDNVTPTQRENIEKIIKQELASFITEVSARHHREFFPLFEQGKLSQKDQEQYDVILNVDERANTLLQKISEYLDIKDA